MSEANLTDDTAHQRHTKRSILNWELWGILFIIILGSIWHFVYQWTGEPAGLVFIFPINESVWEHLKLGFWPVIIFAALEYACIRKNLHNLILAKACGILSLQLFIILFFYGYTVLAGRNFLFLDIASFFLATSLCQYVSYRIMVRPEMKRTWAMMGLLFLLGNAGLFLVFAIWPPDLFIFLNL